MSNASYSTYEIYPSNNLTPIILTALVGISSIGWFIQSIQIQFIPYRTNILLLLSHLCIFVQLILRAVYPNNLSTSRTTSIISTITLAVGQRTIIVANYAFILEFNHPESRSSRTILLAASLCAVLSAVISTIATRLSKNANTINQSFHLRQLTTGLVLSLTVVFYPIWLARKSIVNMSQQAVILLIISSWSCLIVAIYLLIISIPQYYYQTNEEEYWFYIFHLTPIIIAFLTWTICHPKRSLKLTQHEIIEQDTTVPLQSTYIKSTA